MLWARLCLRKHHKSNRNVRICKIRLLIASWYDLWYHSGTWKLRVCTFRLEKDHRAIVEQTHIKRLERDENVTLCFLYSCNNCFI